MTQLRRDLTANESISPAIGVPDDQMAQAGQARQMAIQDECAHRAAAGWNEGVHWRSLAGKTVFIDGCGASDEEFLRNARYLATIMRHASRVAIDGTSQVINLIAGRYPSGLAQDVPDSGLWDYAFKLSELADLFPATHVSKFDIPYLFPTSESHLKSNRQMESLPGVRVGLCHNPADDRNCVQNSTVIERRIASRIAASGATVCWLPTTNLLAPELLSSKHLAEHSANGINNAEEIGRPTSLDELAALIVQMDLVIAADSFVGHLAASMGVPVWYITGNHLSASQWKCDVGAKYLTARVWDREQLDDDYFLNHLQIEFQKQFQPQTCQPVRVDISPGELLDKITILQIKSERLDDVAKLNNVRTELATLLRSQHLSLPRQTRLDELSEELKGVNAQLWDIEDKIRECERQREFGPEFITLARSVYRQNDRRCEIKRAINELLGSRLIEEKSYAKY